ncbi:MAG TPA: glucose 1-dehydrogenase [Syntrophomonadaceae bacterium]|nr:glucose 1-dehydrogenase [Syntrophomonadaceae bacterium]
MRLKDKVAVITGAGSGIGRATAILFAKEGARVVVSDYKEDTARATLDDILKNGSDGIAVKADVSKEAEVQHLMEEAFQHYGRLNVLISNAGIGEVSPVEELSEEAWYRTIDINLKGVFLCAKHAIPHMRKSGGGSIVNNASILGHVGFPGTAAYNAAKGGIITLTKNMALDYAKDKIRVNAVCPGFIRTPMVEEGDVKDQLDYLVTLHPLGRLGEPMEVAYGMLFLASDESSFITGSSLMVDGGYTAR